MPKSQGKGKRRVGKISSRKARRQTQECKGYEGHMVLELNQPVDSNIASERKTRWGLWGGPNFSEIE